MIELQKERTTILPDGFDRGAVFSAVRRRAVEFPIPSIGDQFRFPPSAVHSMPTTVRPICGDRAHVRSLGLTATFGGIVLSVVMPLVFNSNAISK